MDKRTLIEAIQKIIGNQNVDPIDKLLDIYNLIEREKNFLGLPDSIDDGKIAQLFPELPKNNKHQDCDETECLWDIIKRNSDYKPNKPYSMLCTCKKCQAKQPTL